MVEISVVIYILHLWNIFVQISGLEQATNFKPGQKKTSTDKTALKRVR